ncbi:MAG: SOS response-associated peptidase [Candidatus Hydrogenedentota bacterium]
MCGRFAQTPALQSLFSRYKFFGEDEAGVVPCYNIAPTQSVPVIFRDDEGDHLDAMRWGLVPHWSKEIGTKPLFNARAETVATKPSFRTPFKRHRCLVPATGFYEWKKGAKNTKIPYFIHNKDESPMVFAGLWDRWDQQDGTILHSFTIITTRPNVTMKPIHDRMPVILSEEAEDTWLDPNQHDPDHLTPLLNPSDPELIEAYPVSSEVNSASHEGEGCIIHAPSQGDLF